MLQTLPKLASVISAALLIAGAGATTSSARAYHSTSITFTISQFALWELCDEVSASGYCGVKFGMNQEEADAAAPGGLHGREYVNLDAPEDAACYYLGFAENNYDVALMFVQGHVQRIDVDAPNIRTPEGAHVGMKLTDVEVLYPNALRRPNFYVGSRDDLFVELGDGMLAVFETDDDDAVYSFRIGLDGPARYVEGCS